MRVTNSTILRNYDRNLRRLGKAKFDCEQNIYSGRKFSRASENPLNAAKALTVRKQLSHTKQYMENLDVADKFYTEAETSLLQISEKLATVRETLIYACNTPLEKGVDVQILAQQLETYAKEMVSVFNTDSAERAIFGGESNSPEPFTLEFDDEGFATQVLYHGVPLNAYSSETDYPHSKDVFIDIGIGIVIDQKTQEVDPQSALKISFNGAEVTDCGMENYVAMVDLEALEPNKFYALDIYMGAEAVTIEFEAGADAAATAADINDKLAAAYRLKDITTPTIDAATGIVSAGDEQVYVNSNPEADNKIYVTNGQVENAVDLERLTEGKSYSFDVYMNGALSTVTFTAGATAKESAEAINEALKAVYEPLGGAVPKIDSETGEITATGEEVYLFADEAANDAPPLVTEYPVSKNYIQITLDAAAALRRGDLEYANACIDRIVESSKSVLIEIANMGNNEEFISFNMTRFETRELNLKERQDKLEATDLESEITLLKTYEALYNACLQMSSTVVPNTIFNYIR